MKRFEHINATTLDEAESALQEEGSVINAGGTDLLSTLKDDILAPYYPKTVVNIKTIPDMEYVKEEGGMLKIGALTILDDIAKNELIKNKYACLAEAAHRTASPHIREMGTIAGNICQLNRCWYFRKPNNRFNCIRKGGGLCYATIGDARYHSIFGGVDGCVAVNPSDTAPALVALDAKVVTTKRTIAIEEFFTFNGFRSTILDDDEIVTEIQMPEFTGKSAFSKFTLRKSIDFPIVNCATAFTNGSARICLNAIFNNPYRAINAEDAISGQSINDANAESAASAAISNTTTMVLPSNKFPNNKYKVQIAKTLLKRTILACE